MVAKPAVKASAIPAEHQKSPTGADKNAPAANPMLLGPGVTIIPGPAPARCTDGLSRLCSVAVQHISKYDDDGLNGPGKHHWDDDAKQNYSADDCEHLVSGKRTVRQVSQRRPGIEQNARHAHKDYRKNEPEPCVSFEPRERHQVDCGLTIKYPNDNNPNG
jgi:hypothetical protein